MSNSKSQTSHQQSMDRRSFLLGMGGLTLSQLLLGCSGGNQIKFNVQLLKGSIPAQVVNQFQQGLQQKVDLKFAPVEQIQNLFKRLQIWQKKAIDDEGGWTRFIPFRQSPTSTVANLVTLGDYWLKAAIEQKLLQPLEEAEIKQWSTLNPRWQQLVRRNDQGIPDPQGKIWAAPYRWGSTVIVYDREKLQKFGWVPQDWSDLWRDELRSRISLVDQPREVIGLVLKKLGQSYNTENLDTIPNLEKELQAFNQQVKLYSSTTYLEPLIIGDTWLAVGSSSDVIPLLARYPQLTAVVPQSGTAIWSDLWVRPAGVAKDVLSSQWIDFCWQSNIAQQISLLTKSNSPISTKIADYDIAESLKNLLKSNDEAFAKSEFLLPLSQSAAEKYQALFTKIKSN